MDEYDNVLCCGCLCAGRKMVLVDEFWRKQCFLQIIGEISMSQPENLPLWLCWECEALTQRFTRFKKKVKSSYKRLNEFAKQNLDLLQIKQEPVLRNHIQYVIDTSQISCTEKHIHFSSNIVKTENESVRSEDQKESDAPEKAASDVVLSPDLRVKRETDDASIYSEKAQSDSDRECTVIHKSSKKKRKSKDKPKQKQTKTKKAPTPIEPDVYKELVLSQQEIEKERKEARSKEEYTNAVYKCERCILAFPNPDDLKDHTELKHELHSTKFKCPTCECSFASEVSYNYHKNRHTKRFVCTVCEERFSSKRKAIKHHEMCHTSGKTYVCGTCRDEFDNQQDYAAHMSTHPAEESSASFLCPHCDKRFRWPTSLRKHLETHRIHTGLRRKPYCDTCGLSFSNTANLQKHVKTSSKHQIQLKLRKLSQVQPADAAATESTAQDIEQIKLSVNRAKSTHQCPQCDRAFQWRGNLLRHLHSHRARANGELVCKPCDRTFSSIATYNQHMKISRKHVDESDFKHICTECDKRFANKIRLRDHMDWEHLKNYVHICTDCQKIFKSHTSLYLHKQVVHKKNKAEHLCDHCGKPFPNHTKLRSHITALHTAESPYKCTTCGARFNWHSCLSRHNRVLHRQGSKPRRDEASALAPVRTGP